MESDASQCFFRDCTTVTLLTAPIPITLANPSSGLVVAHGSTVLPCPAAPSGYLIGLHLPSFATNLERYFLPVIDDLTCYITDFPLQRKGESCAVLIPWIRAVCCHLSAWFHHDLLVLRLQSEHRGGFFSCLIEEFYHEESIVQSFTLPPSPQQNGIGERHIGLIMEVARTSMIHVAAPSFLQSFAVRYAAHQLNLWTRVS
ncbi:unnamed protein product [Closterium sp. NIES-54]